ncbi:SDR family NAD(P)-dependent oxidoreductase [Cryobacterium glucosi]|uniref:SDR family oxidoreductase n=1 Tax=Cryobacterium glucosi TaxID=1259175 RepID=A0ABY2ILB3_9MICO|nr:SDR family oxidoreductase [Cryobacterium glucosi]TFC16878.1 SDR family oxidoreductase [Cryobacterium glucosi]
MTSTPAQQIRTRLKGRIALVTGATSGIGEAIANALAAEGAHVVVGGRDRPRGDAIVAAIRSSGGRADFIAVDLGGSSDDIREFATDVTRALGGRIDILINNAGIYPATATADLDDTDLEAMLAVNIRAPHVLVGQIAPAMAGRGSGCIVNVGSWMARVGNPFAAMYSATKAAEEQLTRSWAAEFGLRGVRVNTVAPGVTLTPGNEAARPILDSMTAGTPAGMVIRPSDVASGVLFLVSDDARMIHGVILDVDGGISVTRPA